MNRKAKIAPKQLYRSPQIPSVPISQISVIGVICVNLWKAFWIQETAADE